MKRLAHPLTLLGALLYVLAFPPYGLAFLGWFALVPWLVHLASIEGSHEIGRAHV